MTSSKFIKLLAMLLTLCVVFSVTACTSSAPTPSSEGPEASTSKAPVNPNESETTDVEPFRVAVFIALSGANTSSAVFQIQALDLVVEQVNARGGLEGLGGAPIELVYFDNMSDANAMKTVVESAFEDETISFGLFPLASTYTAPAIATIAKAQVPCLTTSQADSLFEQGCDYIYGIATPSSVAAPLMRDFLKYLRDTYNVDTSKIGMVAIDSEFGISMTENYKRLFAEEEGFEVIYDTLYPMDIADMSSIVTALKQKGVKILHYTGLDQDAKLFFNTIKGMDYHPLVLCSGSGVMYPTFQEAMGDDLENVISATHSNVTASTVQGDAEFAELMETCYNRYGHYGGEFLVSYDSQIDIIVQLVNATKSRDREVNNKAMKEMKFETLFQKIDENGEMTKIQYFNEKGISPYSVSLITQFQYDAKGDLFPQVIYPPQLATAELIWEEDK